MATKAKKRRGGRPHNGADELLAVALAGGASVGTAAAQFSLSETTVRRRLRTAAFAARVIEIRAEMSARAVGQTAALLEAAGLRLARLLESNNDAIALGAVREVYNAHCKMRDLVEFARRLSLVEAILGLGTRAAPEADDDQVG